MANDIEENERLDRELIEFLNELRVALPGVQVLAAFLLTIPFSRGWPTTTGLERDLFLVGLLAAVVSTVLLMAPSAYHRILFRHHDKELLLRHSNRLAIAGMAALAVALAVSLFLVAHFVFGSTVAAIATGLVALLLGLAWWAVPLWIRLRR
jgi:hypothetical protein